MSLQGVPVTEIEIGNVSDYAQYITQVQGLEGLPDGATVTFVEHPAGLLEAAGTLLAAGDGSQTIEVHQAILQSVGVEQVMLEQQPVIAHIANGVALAAEETVDIKPPVGKGPFTCPACGKVYQKWNQLQRHAKLHDDDKPWRCNKCQVSFNVQHNLKLHLATHVEDGEPTCPECGKRFSRVASLKAHIMMHEKEESLMCPECGDEFSVQAQLDRHMQEHREEQEGSRIYPCRQCNMEFTKLTALREHMKQHYKIKASLSHRTYKRNIDRSQFSHKCKHCGKMFQKPSQLVRHERIHTGERPFVCNQCNKSFNQKGALHIHMSKHTGERPYECEFCPSTFAQKGNLRAHIQRVHTLTKDSSEETFQCEECTCVFRKLGSLNAHISRAHSMETTELPTQVEGGRRLAAAGVGGEDPSKVDDQQMFQHLLAYEQEVTSGEAGDPSLTSGLDPSQAGQDGDQGALVRGGGSDLLQQALVNSGIGEGGGDVMTSMATLTLPSGSGASGSQPISTMNVHDSVTNTLKRHVIRKVNGVRWHQCTYCSKEFKKPSDLVRHIRIHTQEKPYKCTQCYRAFAVKSTLTAHIKTHTGAKDFRCTFCNKLFSTQGSLKVHVRLHTGSKPFDCPQCDKKFRTSAHRKCHIQSHNRQDGTPGRTRRSIRRSNQNNLTLPEFQLQEPILITDTGLIQQPPRSTVFNQYLVESGSLDRPYKCQFCGRGFKKSSHLKQHVRSHTGERPFRCNQCTRSFVSSGVLKAHVRTHSGVKNYKCVMCESTFTTNGSLKRHMSTHSEVRPFMCPYCQKTFKTSVNCKKHMKTHRHELAMQALQPEGTTAGAELGAEGGLGGEGEEGELGGVEGQVEQDLGALQQQDIGHTTTIAPQEGPPPTSLLPGTSLQDIALDQQLLNQQLFDTQQSFVISSQQNLSQLSSQLNSQLTNQLNSQLTNQLNSQLTNQLNTQLTNQLNSQLTNQLGSQLSGQLGEQLISQSQLGGQMTQLQQGQFTIQAGQMEGGQLVTPFSQNGSMPATSMQSILQTREGEAGLSEEEDEEEEDEGSDAGVLQQEVEEGGKRLHVCKVCNRSFKKSSHLKQHFRSHTGEKPYVCITCDRRFISPGVLKQHQRTHTGLKEFKCSMCEAQFTTNGSLTRHMQIHNGPQRLKCPYCEETFRTAVSLRRHQRTHGEGSDEEYGVPPRRSRAAAVQLTEEQTREMAESVEGEEDYISKKILVESNSEKNRISEIKDRKQELMTQPRHSHQCQHCPKSFKKPSDLLRHTRIHTGEKPFVCNLCNRSFTVKSTLHSHLKTHGPGEKRFKCHICGSQFSTKGSLKVHMRLHTGAKPFKCPHCDCSFRTSGHRKSHITSHFKDGTTKKRKAVRHSAAAAAAAAATATDPSGGLVGEGAAQVPQPAVAGAGGMGEHLMVDNQLLPASALIPVSLVGDDALQTIGLGSAQIPGIEGLQLHLTAGNLTQSIQITGIDPALLGTQNLTIDASLLQQLQQQGTINININPGVLQQAAATADPSTLIHNIQLQQVPMQADNTLVQTQQLQPASMQEAVNPNVIVQPLTSMAVGGQAGLDTSSALSLSSMAIPSAQQPQTLLVVSQDSGTQRLVQMDSAAQHQVVIQQEEGAGTLVGAQATEEEEDDEDLEEEDEEEDEEEEEEDGAGGLQEQNTTIIHGGEGTAADMMDAAPGLALEEAMAADKYLRQFSCDMCPRSFKRSTHLKEHLETHLPGGAGPKKPKPTPHKCMTCNKAFQKPSQLERHIRIHTGERPFKCQLCTKAFNQKNALQVHLKKHSGERPHRCSYCSSSFTQKGNLKTHIKRAHHQDMVQTMNLGAAAAAVAFEAPLGDQDPAVQAQVQVVAGPGEEEEEPAHDERGLEELSKLFHS